jgi:hypothetical protein
MVLYQNNVFFPCNVYPWDHFAPLSLRGMNLLVVARSRGDLFFKKRTYIWHLVLRGERSCLRSRHPVLWLLVTLIGQQFFCLSKSFLICSRCRIPSFLSPRKCIYKIITQESRSPKQTQTLPFFFKFKFDSKLKINLSYSLFKQKTHYSP